MALEEAVLKAVNNPTIRNGALDIAAVLLAILLVHFLWKITKNPLGRFLLAFADVLGNVREMREQARRALNFSDALTVARGIVEATAAGDEFSSGDDLSQDSAETVVSALSRNKPVAVDSAKSNNVAAPVAVDDKKNV